jgi:hypothetical protein
VPGGDHRTARPPLGQTATRTRATTIGIEPADAEATVRSKQISADDVRAAEDAARRMTATFATATLVVRGSTIVEFDRTKRLRQRVKDLGAELRLLRWEQRVGRLAVVLIRRPPLPRRGQSVETGTVARSYPFSSRHAGARVLRLCRGLSRSRRVATMHSCPRCSSSDLSRDGHDQRGRPIHVCGACGRHATADSTSLCQVIASRVTSSCSPFGTTCSLALRPNASLASWPTVA